MTDNGDSDTSNADVTGDVVENIVWNNFSDEALGVVAEISESFDADVIFYNGPLLPPYDYRFIRACAGRVRRDNVILVLVTDGGSADTAFRIAAWLQENYDNFILYVSGQCKSAGTLVAMGAQSLVMSGEYGELGPLDVQMSAPEAPNGRLSGLTFSSALIRMDEEASLAYDVFLSGIMEASGNTVSQDYAMEVAADMVVGLYGQAYAQIDPVHIGEANRAIDIASRYGSRLLEKGQNSDEERLNRLISDYPSHEYVIDHVEAARLFDEVLVPQESEYDLSLHLGEDSVIPYWPDEDEMDRFVPFVFLSAEPDVQDDERQA